MKINLFNLTLASALLLAINVQAKEEFKKNWNKSYEVNKNATLEIDNKFGKVEMLSWEQATIKVDVIISVDAPTQEKADKMLKKVEIKSSGSADKVSIETDIDGSESKDDYKLKIDYTVRFPSGCVLDISNKFGDLVIDKAGGKAVLDVAYGSLKAGSLDHGQNDIEVSFGSGEIDMFGGGEIEVKYSSLNVDEAKSAEMNTAFSKVEIDKIQSLELESAYDKVSIDEVDDLKLEGKFSGYNIDDLGKSLKADVSYGGLNVDEVKAGFSSVDIESSFGGVKLDFADGASYTLEALASKGSISYNKGGMKVIKDESSAGDHEVVGTKGDNPKSTVKVECKMGGIRIN